MGEVDAAGVLRLRRGLLWMVAAWQCHHGEKAVQSEKAITPRMPFDLTRVCTNLHTVLRAHCQREPGGGQGHPSRCSAHAP